MSKLIASLVGLLLLLASFVVTAAAFVTHIILCIKSANYFLLIIGLIFFPVAFWHGLLHWFGVW